MQRVNQSFSVPDTFSSPGVALSANSFDSCEKLAFSLLSRAIASAHVPDLHMTLAIVPEQMDQELSCLD